MTEHSLSKTLGDYIIKRTIGEGTFSKVKLGINKITNEKVAIKILEKSKIVEKDDLDRILREMKIITELNHQNVIKVHEMCESNEYFVIIMEYCEGGELFNYIVENQRLSEEETAYFFYQLINGIEYIHSKGIVHRDLKPENLLLDENKVLKIIDFGLSNFYNGTYLSTPCGSPCYASPEMVSGKSYNGFYIDVWSTGIILFAMMCGYLPFEDPDNDILFKKILAGRLHYPSHLSPLAKDIMKRILVKDPEKRIKIEEIKEHEFYLIGKSLFEKKFNIEEEKAKEVDATTNDFMYHPYVTEGKKSSVPFNTFKDYFENSKKNNKVYKIPKINIVANMNNTKYKSNSTSKQKIQNVTANKTLTTEADLFENSKRRTTTVGNTHYNAKNNSTLSETNYCQNMNFIKLAINNIDKKNKESPNKFTRKLKLRNYNPTMPNNYDKGYLIPNMHIHSPNEKLFEKANKTTRANKIMVTSPNSEKPRLPSIKIVDKTKKNILIPNAFNSNATHINPKFIRLKTEMNNFEQISSKKFKSLRLNDFLNNKMNKGNHHNSNLITYTSNIDKTGRW